MAGQPYGLYGDGGEATAQLPDGLKDQGGNGLSPPPAPLPLAGGRGATARHRGGYALAPAYTSPHSSLSIYKGARVLIVILTGMLLCSALGATGQELTATPPARTGLGELLSRPLPGTLERADDDAARALQGALAGFAGVASAHVIISRAATEDEDAAPPPRRVALQLGLRDGFSPTPAWTEGLAAFVLRAVPDLDAAQLTIVDADATVLYESGRSCLVAPPPEASEPARAAAAAVTTAR